METAQVLSDDKSVGLQCWKKGILAAVDGALPRVPKDLCKEVAGYASPQTYVQQESLMKELGRVSLLERPGCIAWDSSSRQLFHARWRVDGRGPVRSKQLVVVNVDNQVQFSFAKTRRDVWDNAPFLPPHLGDRLDRVLLGMWYPCCLVALWEIKKSRVHLYSQDANESYTPLGGTQLRCVVELPRLLGNEHGWDARVARRAQLVTVGQNEFVLFWAYSSASNNTTPQEGDGRFGEEDSWPIVAYKIIVMTTEILVRRVLVTETAQVLANVFRLQTPCGCCPPCGNWLSHHSVAFDPADQVCYVLDCSDSRSTISVIS